MKVSAFAFASFFSSAAAVEFSLRSAINSFLESAATETYDARIVIGGLYDMVSDDEVKYVSKEVVAAYNNAFGFDKAGQRIGNMETRGFSTIPSDSFWWTDKKEDSDEEAAFINAQVEIQYYKDGFGAPSNWGSLHRQFEQELCVRLRKSGFANFAHAKDCFFSFLEHGGLNNQGPVETATKLKSRWLVSRTKCPSPIMISSTKASRKLTAKPFPNRVSQSHRFKPLLISRLVNTLDGCTPADCAALTTPMIQDAAAVRTPMKSQLLLVVSPLLVHHPRITRLAFSMPKFRMLALKTFSISSFAAAAIPHLKAFMTAALTLCTIPKDVPLLRTCNYEDCCA